MTSVRKPKRALLAYCALADRLNRPDASVMETLTPFFTPVCRDLAGKMFDAAEFSQEVAERYGLRIPRLAVLGLAEQLERDGLLVSTSGQATKSIYKYRAAPQREDPFEVPAVTEAEIDQVLDEFVAVCRTDELLLELDEQLLQEGFLDRLLHTDSMRLLSRKEGVATPKRTGGTLALKAAAPTGHEQVELRLDFHVAQFLLDLQSGRPDLFNRVSDIAFANMAAEALACFSEPTGGSSALTSFSVYLDSPLLLDVLGVNADYTDYGQELLQMMKAAGATPMVFDDCIAEAESVVAAQNAALRSGVVQRASHWGTSAAPHVLNALMNNVGERAADKGISSRPDPQHDLLRRSKAAVGDIQALMTRLMAAWQNQEARNHDERSIWSMLRIRETATLCTKIRDSKAIFVARNTLLVRIANDSWRTWLQAHHSRNVAERWAPIAMSDKQLAGYLWLRNGAGNGTMSRARLLAHCSAAIRPRPDVKVRAYNLVLELHGKQEADFVAALLEDREGERALMRATRADPEDVTPQRLPYILDQVKLAAGQFAAERAREEAREAAEGKEREHEAKIAVLTQTAQAAAERATQESSTLAGELAQETLQRVQLEGRLQSLQGDLAEERRQKQQSNRWRFLREFGRARALYRRLRAEAVALFVVLSFFVSTSTNDWPGWLQTGCTLALSFVGFWFIPDYFDGFIRRHANSFFRGQAERYDIAMLLTDDVPDFKSPEWASLAVPVAVGETAPTHRRVETSAALAE